MTYTEIVEKYKELFVMLVEKAGRETGNTTYLNVDKILKSSNYVSLLNSMIEREPDFQIIVCSLVVALFCDIYGPQKIEDWDEERSYQKLSEFYRLYLRKGTIRFCQRYGIPEFDDPETSFKFISIQHGKTD